MKENLKLIFLCILFYIYINNNMPFKAWVRKNALVDTEYIF